MKKNFFRSEKQIKELLNWNGADGCLATDKITIEGYKVGYMYREMPDNDYDSGWRFLAGMEDDIYMNNSDNIGAYKLNTICNYDELIIPYLNMPIGTVLIKTKNNEFIIDDKTQEIFITKELEL